MRRNLAFVANAVAALVFVVFVVPLAADQTAIDPIVAQWDKGPDSIDVSKYPSDMKKRYTTYVELCGRCHTLARAVNCDFVLEDEWERYIKRMMRRGRGVISPEEGLAIFEFAVYDAKQRKRALYDRKFAAAR